MFGNTLDEVMELQKDRFPDRRLPWVQVTLSEQVKILKKSNFFNISIFNFFLYYILGTFVKWQTN